MRDMSLRICLINQKGGCGKSSVCFHLSGEFARMGLRVLLIDCDPQGSLSQGYFGSALIERLEVADTLAALFADDTTCVASALTPMRTSVEGVFVLPANLHLARHNTPQQETSGFLQHTLRSLVESLDGFDVVLFDCPPNLYQCTWNALLAATHVVIPVPPEDFGTQGLGAVQQAVCNARLLNPELRPARSSGDASGPSSAHPPCLRTETPTALRGFRAGDRDSRGIRVQGRRGVASTGVAVLSAFPSCSVHG